MDAVYDSLAYDGAPLLRISVCVSRALLVMIKFHAYSASIVEINARYIFWQCICISEM